MRGVSGLCADVHVQTAVLDEECFVTTALPPFESVTLFTISCV